MASGTTYLMNNNHATKSFFPLLFPAVNSATNRSRCILKEIKSAIRSAPTGNKILLTK